MPSLSRADRTNGEIDWPAWAERTPASERERTSKYSVTLNSAMTDLRDELLDRVGADDWRLSTAAPHRKRDGLPYADSNPDDPGVAVRWSMDGRQYCVACDRYSDLRDNTRTLGLYVAEKRKMGGRPVETGQDEFATARLPSGEEDDDDVIVAGPPSTSMTDAVAADLLGVSPDSPERVVSTAFQERIKDGHPDQGGDVDVQRLKHARDRLLEN